MKKSVKFSPEVRERTVRLVAECRGDHPSQCAAVESIAAKIGCTAHRGLARELFHATDVVRDALEQALYARQPSSEDALIHHSDRGAQDVAIRDMVDTRPR